MDKFEFASSLDSAIESLSEEENKLIQRYDYFLAINNHRETNETISIKEEIVQIGDKLNTLHRLISLPAYARIKTMSDAEVEMYKNERISEINEKIKIEQSKKEEKSNKIEELKKKQEELISKYSSASEEDKRRIIEEGKEIGIEISELSSRTQYTEEDMTIDQLVKEREELENKSIEDIKNTIISKTNMKGSPDFYYEQIRKPQSRIDWMFVKAGETQEKARAFANLLIAYNNAYNRENENKKNAGISYDELSWRTVLHGDLRQRLKQYDGRNGSFEEVVETINKYKNESEEVLTTQFTPEKLARLHRWNQKRYEIYNYSANEELSFFDSHKDKIDSVLLENLKANIQELEKLENKLFKNKQIKWDIEECKSRINEICEEIYNQILRWYEETTEKYLDSYEASLSWGYENFEKYMENINSAIKENEVMIERVLNTTKEINEKKLHDKEVSENQIKQTQKEIIDLVGNEFNVEDIPYFYSKYDSIIQRISDEKRKQEEKNFARKIVSEAQQESNKKEAEIRGMTLEELLKSRNKIELLKERNSLEETKLQHMDNLNYIEKTNQELDGNSNKNGFEL